MKESFDILIDRLKNGQAEKIAGAYDPSFLEIEENDLLFGHPVIVSGEAYLTEGELILHLNAETRCSMPCSICNEMTNIELKIKDFYHAQPVGDIRNAIFNFKETLREALLIELPPFVECGNGQCPQRPLMTPYLRATKREEKPYFPFANIDDL